MAPFSMQVKGFILTKLSNCFFRRCNTCGEYVYKGKKFNARKETVEGEDYLGIKIFRFYIKWQVNKYLWSMYLPYVTSSTLCSAEITFKTDPKNTDYTAEHGASRNFEPWRDEGAEEEVDRLAKLEEEENNPMKVLENKTVDSKREMDILDALQDIRARNARNERVGLSEDLLAKIGLEEETEDDAERKRLEEEDEKLVQEVFSKVTTSGNSVVTVKRKADDHESPLHSLLSESTRSLIASHSSLAPAAKKRKPAGKNLLGIKIAKKGLNHNPS